MARFRFTNIAKGPRGVRGMDGVLAMIEPGESALLDVDDGELRDAKAGGAFSVKAAGKDKDKD
jgi:hypothetical protein